MNPILKLINHVTLSISNTSTINNNIKKTYDDELMKMALIKKPYMSAALWTSVSFTINSFNVFEEGPIIALHQISKLRQREFR